MNEMKSVTSNRSNLTKSQRERLRSRLKGRSDIATGIVSRSSNEPAPLSFSQRRLWFLDRLLPDNPFYNVPSASILTGTLDIDKFRASVSQLMERHEALRTSFKSVNGALVQVVNPDIEMTVPITDLSFIENADEQQQEAERLITKEAAQPFDLSVSVIRVSLLKLAAERHTLLITMHHIVTDGWSLRLFMRDLAALYLAQVSAVPPALPSLPVQYSDYAIWQNNWISEKVGQSQLQFWRSALADLPASLELPFDHVRPAVQSFNGVKINRILPKPLLEEVSAYAQSTGCTLYTVLLSAFFALLHRYSGQSDLVVGTPTAGRNRSEVEDLVGLFVNTLALRVKLDEKVTAKELLSQVRTTTIGAYDNQDLPFEMIVSEICGDRDMSVNPVVQATFTLQSNQKTDINLPGLEITPNRSSEATVRFDLELHLYTTKDGLNCVLVYNSELFKSSTMEMFLSRFERVLTSVVSDPECIISSIPLLSDDEQHAELSHWKGEEVTYKPISALELIKHQLNATPEAQALSSEGGDRLSYEEMWARSHVVAHQLRELGVGKESIVSVCMERCPNLVVSLLGVWLAGGAYVPIDPQYPVERKKFMLEDSGSVVVLVGQVTVDEIERELPSSVKLLNVHQLLSQCSGSDVDKSVEVPLPTLWTDLAYIIYTSGSTGLPKGVMIEHRHLSNYLQWCTDHYDIGQCKGSLVHGSISFDATITSVFAPLLCGGEVQLAPEGTELEALRRSLNDTSGPVLLKITPSHLELMKRWLPAVSERKGSDGPVVVIGGEALRGENLTEWRDSLPGARFFNEYGPTETVVGCCVYEVKTQYDGPVPIGRPITNTWLRLLDAYGHLVPAGAVGELCIGGAGVGRGYIGAERLTEERFVPDPSSEGNFLYRSGDLARDLGSEGLEYCGRRDDQVKLRGYRIELGEIEAQLIAEPSVREAAALVREDRPGDQRLIAYIVMRDDEPTSEDTIAHVSSWGDVFQASYGDIDQQNVDTHDFAGWQSTYTGKPIPRDEMREWLNRTLLSIREISPQRVMEIGAGTGLIATQIAPLCDTYVATDFSADALAHIARLKKNDDSLAHLQLRQLEALEAVRLVDGKFDLIVINSVAQYFPNLTYLKDVLHGAVARLAPGGSIFVGDVRNYALFDEFQAAVQLRNLKLGMTVQDAREGLTRMARTEKELLVHPRFFVDIEDQVEHLQIHRLMPKTDRYVNELSAFRYDVVLKLGEPEIKNAAIDQVWHDSHSSPLDSAAIVRLLSNNENAMVGLTGIANSRLNQERAYLNRLKNGRGDEVLEEFNELATGTTSNALTPRELIEIGESLGRPAQLWWAHEAIDGDFSVFFPPIDALDQIGDYVSMSKDWFGSASCDSFTNKPLETATQAALVPVVREALRARLPRHMIPNSFVVLETMPLTSSGKLDKEALPIPQAAPVRTSNFVAARTPTEKRVASIWADALDIGEVGVTDNFFELGGHSLLTTKVVLRIAETLNVTIALRVLFQSPTVEEIAVVIDAALSAGVQEVNPANETIDLGAEAVLAPSIQPDLDASSVSSSLPEGGTILLTGVTGFLGAFLLKDLLEQTNSDIVCIVRAKTQQDARVRIENAMGRYELNKELVNERVSVVLGDLSQPNLGLDVEGFKNLGEWVDSILHNGAWVNFNYPYSMLKPTNVLGTQEVIRLACESRCIPLHYVSTVSVYAPISVELNEGHARVRNEYDPANNWQDLVGGYAQSKWVAEQLVLQARDRGLPVSIYRPGSVSGDTETGACNADELLFRLICSCIKQKQVPPTGDASIGLVPVDYVSGGIVQLLTKYDAGGIYHLANPKYSALADIYDFVRSSGYELEPISYELWRENLIADATKPGSDNAMIPFLPMLPASQVRAESIDPEFGCVLTVDALQKYGVRCAGIDQTLIETYLDYFRRIGLIGASAKDNK